MSARGFIQGVMSAGGYVRKGFYSGGYVRRGFCPQGVLFRGLCPQGVLSARGFIQGVMSAGGFVRKGFYSGGYVRRGFCPRSIVTAVQMTVTRQCLHHFNISISILMYFYLQSGHPHYITERSVRWYYGFSIAAAAAAAAAARRPWRREHCNSYIQPISFKFYMRADTPLRYFAIEIWYPPRTRTTAFAAKRHSYPPNLQNAISP